MNNNWDNGYFIWWGDYNIRNEPYTDKVDTKKKFKCSKCGNEFDCGIMLYFCPVNDCPVFLKAML